MMNWPCAMLMTPATPKMMASPSAAMMRMAATLKPMRNCEMSACHIARALAAVPSVPQMGTSPAFGCARRAARPRAPD